MIVALAMHLLGILSPFCHQMHYCGICGVERAIFGGIYFSGVYRCNDCCDWEMDNAPEWYLQHLNYGGRALGHMGKGKEVAGKGQGQEEQGQGDCEKGKGKKGKDKGKAANCHMQWPGQGQEWQGQGGCEKGKGKKGEDKGQGQAPPNFFASMLTQAKTSSRAIAMARTSANTKPQTMPKISKTRCKFHKLQRQRQSDAVIP